MKSPIRVLVIPSWYPNERNKISGVFFKEQAEALKRYGDDVRVAAPILSRVFIWSRRKMFAANEQISIENGVKTYCLSGVRFFPPNPWGNFLVFAWRLFLVTRKIIKKDGWMPDVLHLHSAFWGLPGAVFVSYLYKLPLVVTEHSSVYFRKTRIERLMLSFPLVVPVLKFCYRRADLVISVSPALSAAMRSTLGIETNEIIPNLIPDKIIRDVRRATNEFKFFCLAGLVEQKGIDVLILAADILRSKYFVNFSIEIGGDGILKDKLKNMVIQLDLSDRISFAGEIPREKVVDRMSAMSCFVLPSRMETFGVVYAEAIMQGKPVIATRCGGAEYIVNKKNGILVDVDNPEQLADAMYKMICEYDRYIPEDIRTDAATRFGELTVVERIHEQYFKLLDNRRNK